MRNSAQPGHVIDYTIPSATTIEGGDVVIIGKLVGVAVSGGTTGDVIAVNLTGAYTLPKESPLAISQGDKLYWATDDKEITKTATDTPIGYAFASAGSTDAEVVVVLDSMGATQAATVEAITTANGSDAATTQALANATKTTVNAILTALKGAGIMASA